jgi:hypothetical protein
LVAAKNDQDQQLTFDELMCFLEEDYSSPEECPEKHVREESQEKLQLTVKYDMGWQKRSSGRKYDSRSGVGTMIGEKTGKILGCGVRIKDCRMCTLAERKSNAKNAYVV